MSVGVYMCVFAYGACMFGRNPTSNSYDLYKDPQVLSSEEATTLWRVMLCAYEWYIRSKNFVERVLRSANVRLLRIPEGAKHMAI